jgi:predicted transposase/invertase (TIGR01784 family)
LQIHLIELPKYIPPDDNEPIGDPVDQWLFFFRHAEKSTGEELTRRLPHPVFKSATGVLQMIAKNPDERRLYNSRLKMERDARARVDLACEEAAEKAAEKAMQQGIEKGMQQGMEKGIEQGIQKGMEQGIEQGLERGEIMGEVKALRRLLGEPPISQVEFVQMTNAQLIALRDELLRRCDAQAE